MAGDRLAFSVQMKGSIFGWLMGQLMIRPMMRRMFARIIRGLETHLETGALIGQDGQPMLAATVSAQ